MAYEKYEKNVDDKNVEKVIKISRVNKVVKGGKRMSFRALVIVGDQEGNVGMALGKAAEVPNAIRKAVARARKSQISVQIVEHTIPHLVTGRYSAAVVRIIPAPPGTGVIAGGAVRTILEACGLQDVVAKSLGSSNAINNAHATLKALSQLMNLDAQEALRGKRLPVFVAGRKKVGSDENSSAGSATEVLESVEGVVLGGSSKLVSVQDAASVEPKKGAGKRKSTGDSLEDDKAAASTKKKAKK